MEIVQFFESLFTFNAYWKIALLVVILGAGIAYAVTQGVNKTGKRARKGEPDPSWWGLMLRSIATLVGTGIGLAVDLGVKPLVPEGTEASAPVLSALLGCFSGAFCAAIVWLVKSKLVKRNPDLARAPLDGTFSVELPPDGDLDEVEKKKREIAEPATDQPETGPEPDGDTNGEGG